MRNALEKGELRKLMVDGVTFVGKTCNISDSLPFAFTFTFAFTF
jgi:hypothetical protein